MEFVVLLVAVGVGAAGAAAVWVWFARAAPAPPPRAWKGDTVTPLMMGPRSKAPERVARDVVLAQGTALAFRLAGADGPVGAPERDAIAAFLANHVAQADPDARARALSEAEAQIGDELAFASAIEVLRAVGSPEQRALVLDLLVHVARADGEVSPAQQALVQQVGQQLGLPADELAARLALDP